MELPKQKNNPYYVAGEDKDKKSDLESGSTLFIGKRGILWNASSIGYFEVSAARMYWIAVWGNFQSKNSTTKRLGLLYSNREAIFVEIPV